MFYDGIDTCVTTVNLVLKVAIDFRITLFVTLVTKVTLISKATSEVQELYTLRTLSLLFDVNSGRVYKHCVPLKGWKSSNIWERH